MCVIIVSIYPENFEAMQTICPGTVISGGVGYNAATSHGMYCVRYCVMLDFLTLHVKYKIDLSISLTGISLFHVKRNDASERSSDFSGTLRK